MRQWRAVIWSWAKTAAVVAACVLIWRLTADDEDHTPVATTTTLGTIPPEFFEELEREREIERLQQQLDCYERLLDDVAWNDPVLGC